jgi:hypothetical protein
MTLGAVDVVADAADFAVAVSDAADSVVAGASVA